MNAPCVWFSTTGVGTDRAGKAVMSISAKIGCVPQTLNNRVKNAEVNNAKRPAVF